MRPSGLRQRKRGAGHEKISQLSAGGAGGFPVGAHRDFQPGTGNVRRVGDEPGDHPQLSGARAADGGVRRCPAECVSYSGEGSAYLLRHRGCERIEPGLVLLQLPAGVLAGGGGDIAVFGAVHRGVVFRCFMERAADGSENHRLAAGTCGLRPGQRHCRRQPDRHGEGLAAGNRSRIQLRHVHGVCPLWSAEV